MAIKEGFTTKEKLASADLNTNFKGLKGTHASDNIFVYNETPANVTTGVFQTAYPYLPTTLRVYLGQTVSTVEIGMTRQVRNKDYQETKIDVGDSFPQRITFLTSPGSGLDSPDVSGNEVRCDYTRADL